MLDDLMNSARKGIGNLADGLGVGERTEAIIDDWLTIFPQLAEYGLSITSFSMAIALSPSLEVELVGRHGDWSDVAIAQRLAAHRGEKAITMVITTIRTAYRMQRKTAAPLRDPLILKLTVKITPEVRVVLGQPVLED